MSDWDTTSRIRLLTPVPDKPELQIDDCKLNIQPKISPYHAPNAVGRAPFRNWQEPDDLQTLFYVH
jgi:hypothetical protein